jgi:phosphoglycolate phosphatase
VRARPLQYRGRPVLAVLFDLDGTLIDSVRDVALALNRGLADSDLPPVPLQSVRDFVGRGAPLLVERALEAQGLQLDAPSKAALLARFTQHYQDLLERDESQAAPYEGAQQALRELRECGSRLAVVTNKPQQLALGALAKVGLLQSVDTVVGGGICERGKPDPQPLLFACGALQVQAAEALMVGDSLHDVAAARAAGMPVVCVPYGYNEGQDPRSLPCDDFIERLDQLPDLLTSISYRT